MHILSFNQNLPICLDKAWDFFINPQNLKILTPKELNFKISTETKPIIYSGQIINYTVYPFFNLPFNWITEITEVQEKKYFIDEQIFGPYKFWYHEHHFEEVEKGVAIRDLIYYKMPYGPIGEIFHQLKIKDDLNKIFSYRKNKLEEIFGVYE